MRMLLAAAALVAGLSACAGDESLDPTSGPVPAPEGWRWESFGDAEVGVPDTWRHATGDVAAQLWCISDAASAQPVVLRPGIPVESTCPGGAAGEPDPATLVENAGTFVSLAFAASDPQARLGLEGDRMTIRLGAVLVRVQAEPDRRAAILETLHQISVDANGCPTSHPISTEPTRRPDMPVSVEDLGPVRSFAVCRYAIPNGRAAGPLAEPEDPVERMENGEFAGADPSVSPTPLPSSPPPTIPPGTPTLLSSRLLTGDAAAEAIRGIAESKIGTGPDAEDGCDESHLRGPEAIVLRIPRGEAEAVEIYLRYGGCRNGFDDGVDERVLTRDAVDPFVSAANAVPTYGDELARILDDPDAPPTSGNPADSAGGPGAPEWAPSPSPEASLSLDWETEEQPTAEATP